MSMATSTALPSERIWSWLGARILISIVTCILVGWCVQNWMLERQLDSFAQQSRPRADFYRLSLESLLSRNESLPRILAMSEPLKALLKRPEDRNPKHGANNYLLDVKNGADINAVYLLDRKGLTLASSNYALESSFVGKNYGYRPYFREAVKNGFGRFYGIGVTTGEPGYFLAAPITDKGKIIGAVAVKISLDDFESAFTRSGDLVLLVDAYGVIFLTSVPQWKYRTLAPLDAEAKRQLETSRQYSDVLQPPLKAKLRLQEEHHSIRIALPNAPAQDYLIQSVPTGTLGWSIVLLTPTRQEHQNAVLAGVAAGFALALMFATLIFFRLSIKRYNERRMAEARMQQEYRELENRIAERTTDLLAANVSLEDKIEALKSTESILRETRDSAVQAGKLAVLGQMAAGISHEVNQPLTALHTYTDNAVSLLEMGRLNDVRDNLGFIKQMAVRMGNIVGEIKTFARKPAVERLEVRVGDIIRQAVMLVDTHRRQVGGQIDVASIDDELIVWADLQRLEQVIVNLLLNSLDSVAEASEKRIEVSVTNGSSHVKITILDHGPGIPAEVLPRLFEPFFTTKSSGQGLGLGLAISRMIVSELGGRIDARNLEPCGAEFTVVLEKA